MADPEKLIKAALGWALAEADATEPGFLQANPPPRIKTTFIDRKDYWMVIIRNAPPGTTEETVTLSDWVVTGWAADQYQQAAKKQVAQVMAAAKFIIALGDLDHAT